MATASVTNTFTNGTPADAIEVNTNFADLVTFLNNSVVHRDGTKAFTANQPMGGFKLTGLAAGSGAGDSVRFEQLVAGIPATIIDAKGDLIVGSAADTAVRRAVGANGTVLTADSGEADGVKWAVGAGKTYVYKTADESVASSTTLQDDDHLFFTTVAAGIYAFEMLLWFTSASSNPDLKWQLIEPDGTFVIGYQTYYLNSSQPGHANEGSSFDTEFFTAGEVADLLWVRGIIEAGGAGGTFKLQWAQANSDATAMTIKKGSFLNYKKLN